MRSQRSPTSWTTTPTRSSGLPRSRPKRRACGRRVMRAGSRCLSSVLARSYRSRVMQTSPRSSRTGAPRSNVTRRCGQGSPRCFWRTRSVPCNRRRFSTHSRRRRLVETTAPRQPLHRLAGHAGDCVEVTVVMEECRPVHFGNCCDKEVDRGRAAVLATLGEGSLSPRR